MASRRLEVVITGSANDAVSALGQTERAVGRFDRTSSRAGSRFSSTWRSGIGQVGRAIGGLVAGAGLAMFFQGAMNEAQEAQRVMRQTNAVIQSTGGVAGVTARHLAGLAGDLSRLAGVDDEVIQQGGNLLLTFRNVRAEGGIFDDALASALDMSAAMGTQLQPNIMAVGRALNDPIAGISRLTRMGVTFTDKQKEQIAAMQFFGDTAGAQRIILEELATEFGGAAEANATASERMSVAWGNVQEAIGSLLLPAFDRLSTALAGASEWFTSLDQGTQGLIAGVTALTLAFAIMWATFGAPVTITIAAIAAIAAEYYWLYTNVEQVRAIINAVWQAIQLFAATAVAAIQSIDWEPLIDAGRDLWAQVQALGQSFGGWGNVARAAGIVIGAAILGVIGFLRSAMAVLVPVISGFIRLGAISLAGVRAAVGALRTAVSGVSSAVSTAWQWVQKLAANNLGSILGAARALASPFISAANAARGLLATLSSIANRIASMPRLSVGGIGLGGYANGTESAARGLAVVGERGPELVSFRGGERVFTAGQTRAMLGGGGGGGMVYAPITIIVEGSVMTEGDLVDAVGSGLRRGHTSSDLEAYVRRVTG